MELVLVVARARNGVIGKDGAMPWHLPADLKRFKRMTVGKPLPGRQNIVLTRDRGWRAEGVTVVANLAEAVAAAGLDPRARADGIMVIGGAQVYAEALPSATRVELTEIDAEPEGDTVLPALDPARWREVAREAHPAADGQPGFAFVTLVRV
jgi:dihydrofolate reductase